MRLSSQYLSKPEEIRPGGLISLPDAITTDANNVERYLPGNIVVQTRRDFIAGSALSLLSLGGCGVVYGGAREVRSLALLALHTNEYIHVPYRADGELLQRQLPAIHYLLRDHRTDEVHTIDPLLLDYLFDLGVTLGMTEPFHVISGFRSASTNEQLRRSSSGVASRSLHLSGRAVDIRVPDLPAARVRDAAMALKRGGVGFYPQSNFVHLDTGRFRHW